METANPTNEIKEQKSLRLWPGVILLLLQWLFRFVIPAIDPDMVMIGVFAGLIGGILIILWWAFFSRAPIFERWSAIAVMIIVFMVTANILDVSIATGARGLMYTIFAVPVLSLAFIGWAIITRQMSNKVRRISMYATIILSLGFWTLLRNNGITGDFGLDLAWRWAKTPEEKLLEQNENRLDVVQADSAALSRKAEWAGFRGSNRNGIISGVKIKTDWATAPPVELWRHPVGPGCSSFAVQGDLLYTQEQRGEFEMVTCYELNTGEPVWHHQDSTRFWDSHAGAGPRSTPTLYEGKVYTLGATGILNVLDALTGNVIWSRNAAADTKVTIPGWAYTSSPLIVDSVVVVAISGQPFAYDIVSGKLLWSGPDGGESYSSPHLMTIDGTKQVVFMDKSGVTAYTPNEGKKLWNYAWTGGPIVQPWQITENDILISPGNFQGIKRVSLKNENNTWSIKEQWTSDKLKPYFNDFVLHKGHIYGFDNATLVCIDAERGELKWKGGRYAGELILLADQDLLIVLSEKGKLALVKAEPEQFTELTDIQALKGKTWNHPIMVRNLLVVRNMEEMVAYRLPLEGS